MTIHLRQQYPKFVIQLQYVLIVKFYIVLNVSALMQQVPQQPITDILVETLQKTCTNRHNTLKVLYFKWNRCYYTVQFDLMLHQILRILILKVTTSPIQILTMLIIILHPRLLQLRLLQKTWRQDSKG
jgi:hypothetical protein